jgi:uncharacterized protein (TIGR03083 family)
MRSVETWKYIHGERGALVETLASLSAEQWSTPSWCQGWSVQVVVGHVLAAAEQTPLNFYKELAQAGFRFNVFTERGAERLSAMGPDELVRRLRARTTTTNHRRRGRQLEELQSPDWCEASDRRTSSARHRHRMGPR